MTGAYERAQEAAAAARAAGVAAPAVGVILGSGLGAFADQLEGAVRVPYAQLPHMPGSGVIGHRGELVAGHLRGVPCVALAGRAHVYEGHSPATATFGVRLLAALGAGCLVVTNAAGGIDPTFAAGDLMVIRDHLNLTGQSALAGPNDDRLGPRFFDMGSAYGVPERAACGRVAARLGLSLQQGVYAGVLGPNYETPAEVAMLGRLGAAAVGMSTVHEVIVARHMGLRVLGISLISNLAAGLAAEPLSHAEVTATAARTQAALCALLAGCVVELARPPAPAAPPTGV